MDTQRLQFDESFHLYHADGRGAEKEIVNK
jgi:hypothetical protein